MLLGREATTKKGKSCFSRNAPRSRLFPVEGYWGIVTFLHGHLGLPGFHITSIFGLPVGEGEDELPWWFSILCQVVGRSWIASRPFPSLSFLVGAESTVPNDHIPDLPGRMI